MAWLHFTERFVEVASPPDKEREREKGKKKYIAKKTAPSTWICKGEFYGIEKVISDGVMFNQGCVYLSMCNNLRGRW